MKLIFKKIGNSLAPSDDQSYEALAKLKNGDLVEVLISKKRNLQHHRLFFALARKVFENIPEGRYDNLEAMVTAIKVGVGHCDIIPMKSGEVCYIPHSISFETMQQHEFDVFFQRAVNLIVKDLLPGIDKEALLAEVYQML